MFGFDCGRAKIASEGFLQQNFGFLNGIIAERIMSILVAGLWSVMIMVLPVRKRVSWLILPVIAILSFSAGVFAADAVKIMPLGDSITRGVYGSPVNRWGYRQPLYVSLTNGGYNFDFVGGQTDGNFPDPNHEGHDGWTSR